MRKKTTEVTDTKGNEFEDYCLKREFLIVPKDVAINFVKNGEIRILRDIEQYYSTQIDEMPMNGEIIILIIQTE